MESYRGKWELLPEETTGFEEFSDVIGKKPQQIHDDDKHIKILDIDHYNMIFSRRSVPSSYRFALGIIVVRHCAVPQQTQDVQFDSFSVTITKIYTILISDNI